MRLTAGLGFVLVAFSLNSVMTRWIVAGGLLDPGLTTAIRFLSGAAALAVLLAVRGGLRRARPTRASLLPAFWLGAYAVLISYGYAHVGAAAGTFVFYACVLGTMSVGGTILDGTRPTARALAGGVVALAGLAVLTVGKGEGTTLLGIALLAGTGFSWGAYSLMGRRAGDPMRFTAANFFALALALVLPTVLVGAGALGEPVVSARGIGLTVFMGVVTTALSYVVWYWCLPRITPTQAGTYQLGIPVLTGLLAVGLLHESFTAGLSIAGVLIILGMALATPRRPEALGQTR